MLEIGHGFGVLVQVGVGYAALLQGQRHQRAGGPVGNEAAEAVGGGLVVAGLKGELGLLEHGFLGVARVGADFEQRGQGFGGLVAAAQQAQGATFLVVGVVLVGGVGDDDFLVQIQGLRVAFGQVVGVGQAQGGVVVVGGGGLGGFHKRLELRPGAGVLLGVVVGVAQAVAGLLHVVGLALADAALAGAAGGRGVGGNGLGVLLADAVNLAAQHLGGGPQPVIRRKFQRLIEQRQGLGVLAVVVERGGLRVGHALVGGVEAGAALVEVFEVGQGLGVVGGREKAGRQQLIHGGLVFGAREFLLKILQHVDGFGQVAQLVLHLAQLEGGVFGNALLKRTLPRRLKRREGLGLLVVLQVAQPQVVGRVLAQRIAPRRHALEAGNGPLEIALLVVGIADFVLQRGLDAPLAPGGVAVEILRRFLKFLLLVVSIAHQQLHFVGALGQRVLAQAGGGVGNEAVVVAFFVEDLGHHGGHHGLVGIVLLGHGQVGAGLGVGPGAVGQVAGVVAAGVAVLALGGFVAVEEQAGLVVLFLLEVSVGQLKVRLGPLGVGEVVGGHPLQVADGGRVVFLVEVKLAQLEVRHGRARVGRVLLGKVEDEPLGVGVQQVQAAEGHVVLGIGGAVAGGGAGAAGPHGLDGQVLPKRLLGRAVLLAVEEFEPFLKVALVAGKHLGLLGQHGGGRGRGQRGGQRQPGK